MLISNGVEGIYLSISLRCCGYLDIWRGWGSGVLYYMSVVDG